jgi:hypothetical protein
MRQVRFLAVLCFASIALVVHAGETLRQLGTPDATFSASGAPGGRRIPVTTVESPPITTTCWVIRGDVSYHDVQGTGYLEMWSFFPDGSRYFSRTLADAGPMKSLSGSSGRRPFVVPFFSKEGIPAPVRLEFAVVLPGGGEIELSNTALVQYRPGEDPFTVSGAWFGESRAGLAGGLAGGILGCVGALVGLLSSRGKARGLVLSLARGTVGLGVVLVFAGAVSFLRGQPPGVWGPFLLIGFLAAAVMGGNLPAIRKRYEEAELRRIQSLDAL